MCFRWLKRIYHFLRRKCARRNRGYSREISLHHRGSCSGDFSTRHGHGSFSCDGEGSVTYSRRPSSCPPAPAPSPYSISGRFSCDADGSVVISGECGGTHGRGTSGWGASGRGTSDWDVTVGTVPVYGSGVGMGYSSEDLGPVVGSVRGGGGPVYHGGDLGISEGVGSGYGYTAPPRDALTTGGISEGSGYYSGVSGYGIGTFPGPELGTGGGGCAQVVQQKCPVVIPSVKTQQCKQSTHWPPSQKK